MCLCTLLLASVLFWMPGFKYGYFVRVPRELIFMAAGAVITGLWLTRRWRWIGILVIWLAVTTMMRAIQSVVLPPLAYYHLFGILAGAWILIAFHETLPRWRDAYIKIIAFLVGVQLVMVALHTFNLDPVKMYGKGQVNIVIGTLDNPSLLAGYLAVALPLLARSFPILAVLALALMVYANSVLPMFALAAAGAVYLWSKFGGLKAFGGTVGAFALASVFTVFYNGFNFSVRGDLIRLEVWKAAFKASFMHPIAGHGLSSFHQGFTDYAIQTGTWLEATRWIQAHSEPIQLIVEGGWVTLIILALIVFSLVRRYCKAEKTARLVAAGASCAALVVYASAHFPFHVASHAALGLFVVAELERALS